MKSIAIVIISIFIGITIAIPIKDHEIDELVMRVNELRRLNPVQENTKFYIRSLDSIGGGNLLRSIDSFNNFEELRSKQGFYGRNGLGELNDREGGSQKNLLKTNEIGGVQRRKRAIDLDRNPLLYGYYSGVLNNIYDKRNTLDNENDEHSFKKVLILQDAFQPSDYTASLLDEPYGKRNFDEIDRALIGGLKKRLFSYRLPRLLNNYENGNRMDISSKRNFDEIDRAGFTTLKRNFDEIDRAGFVGLKRSFLNKNPSSSLSLSGDNLNMEKRNAI